MSICPCSPVNGHVGDAMVVDKCASNHKAVENLVAVKLKLWYNE